MVPDFPSRGELPDVLVLDCPNEIAHYQIWRSSATNRCYPTAYTATSRTSILDWRWEHIQVATLEVAQQIIALHQRIENEYRGGLGPHGFPKGANIYAWQLITEGVPPGLAVFHQLYGFYPVDLSRFTEQEPVRGFLTTTGEELIVPMSAEHPYLLSFCHPFQVVWFLRESCWGKQQEGRTRYWRIPTGIPLSGLSASDIVRHEQEAGNDLGVSADLLAELVQLSSSRLIWACPRFCDALRYGDAPEMLDVAGQVIADDGNGRALLLLDESNVANPW